MGGNTHLQRLCVGFDPIKLCISSSYSFPPRRYRSCDGVDTCTSIAKLVSYTAVCVHNKLMVIKKLREHAHDVNRRRRGMKEAQSITALRHTASSKVPHTAFLAPPCPRCPSSVPPPSRLHSSPLSPSRLGAPGPRSNPTSPRPYQ